MIKILFYIDKFAYNGSIGGAEKALITLVNHMNPDLFDITVQTLYPESFAKLLNSNITYRYCYPRKNVVTDLLYRAEAELGLTYPLHIKDDYDIEVAYLEFDSTKVISASNNKKAKKIAWVHCDFDIAIHNKPVFIKKTQGQYKKYDKIVCVSDKCKESFDHIFESNFDSIVIHNVIDDGDIIAKAKMHLPKHISKRKKTICSVGNFSPAKNHLRLLKACHTLLDEGNEFELWLIGDGMLRDQIERYVKDHQLYDSIKLFGFQSNPYPFMYESDILVCSSDFEGFSTFICEGVILGKPILTTDCSGMHDILNDYDAGIIVENSDEAFLSGLRKCLQGEISHNPKVRNSFALHELVKENEHLFESIINS